MIIPNLKKTIEHNDYLEYDIKDSRYEDTALIYIEVNWSAQVNQINGGSGVGFEVYSIDQFKASYDVLDIDGNAVDSSVLIEASSDNQKEWAFLINVNDCNKDKMPHLILTEVNINWDDKRIEIVFN